MRLCTRARYGTRAMVDLAVHYKDGPITLRDISKRQEVSESYLENLMTPLRIGGLVRTERGNRGGYTLSRDPSQISLSEVVRILDGSLAPVACVDDETVCHRAPQCVTRRIWHRLQKAMVDVLDAISLADMVQMQRELVSPDEGETADPKQQFSYCDYYI